MIEARDLVYEDSKFDMVKKVGPSPPYCAIKIEDLHTHHKVLRHKEHAPKRTTCPVWNLPPSGCVRSSFECAASLRMDVCVLMPIRRCGAGITLVCTCTRIDRTAFDSEYATERRRVYVPSEWDK